MIQTGSKYARPDQNMLDVSDKFFQMGNVMRNKVSKKIKSNQIVLPTNPKVEKR